MISERSCCDEALGADAVCLTCSGFPSTAAAFLARGFPAVFCFFAGGPADGRAAGDGIASCPLPLPFPPALPTALAGAPSFDSFAVEGCGGGKTVLENVNCSRAGSRGKVEDEAVSRSGRCGRACWPLLTCTLLFRAASLLLDVPDAGKGGGASLGGDGRPARSCSCLFSQPASSLAWAFMRLSCSWGVCAARNGATGLAPEDAFDAADEEECGL